MAHEMYDAVRRLTASQPFEPFVIIMDNGERITLHHHEFVVPMKGWDLILVQRPEDPEGRLISPHHIREITRPHPQGAAA